jgi:hypothetical protein
VYHLRIARSRTARALAAAVTGGGVLTAGSVALVLAGASPAAAAGSGPTLSAPVSYSCDLNSYRQGLAPLTVRAMINAPSTVALGTPLTVTLVTSVTTIPAATAAVLPMMNSISLTGVATLSGPGTLDDSLAGRGQYADGEIPSLTGTGTVTPQTAGTMSLTAPSLIHLVPSEASGTMAPVACTAAAAARVQVTVLAGSAGTGPAGTGAAATGSAGGIQPAGTQEYTCAVRVNVASGGAPVTSVVPMRLSAVGPDAVAADDQVSLTSAALGEPMAGATPTATAASLGLAGASGGSIPLAAGMRGGELALTGRWTPMSAGLFRLTAPHRFQVTMRTTTAVTVMVVCTAATVTTTTTTVRVAASAMPSAASAGIAASETTPTPASAAPDTGAGGSLHSPVDLALLAAGVAAVAAGAAAMLLAIRRRGRAMTP